MSYAVMPITDWQNIVDAVRAKTGKENALVSSQVPAEISSISGGGSGGGASLNIAYGDTAPEDTSKLWVKATEPNSVIVSPKGGEETATIADEETIEALSTTLSTATTGISVASVDKKAYLFGGFTGGINHLNTISCFDTETDELSTLSATLPNAARDIGVAAVGKKIYLFGGYYGGNGSYYRTISCFDTETGTISSLSSLPVGISGMGVAAVDEKIFLFGGANNTSQAYCFDAALNTISTLASLPKSMKSVGVATVGKKIYLLGGNNGSTYYNEILCYNSETGVLDTLPVTLPKTMAYMGVATVGKKIYLLGGNAGSSNRYNTIIRFDTETNDISTLPIALPITALYDLGVTTVGTKIYSFGGSQNGTTHTNKIYKLTTSVATISLNNGTLLLVALNKSNFFDLVASETATITVGVDRVYKGNENNEGEEVEAALYKDGTWTTI